MKKKGILKKQSGPLKIAVVTTLVSLAILNGGGAIIGNVTLADYAKNSQIQNIMQELDCDSEYISERFDKFVKMQHNGDEPIYVCIDELNEQEKSSAVYSLDYVFGIVGDINANYRYELVDKKTFNKKILKTKILYQLGDENVSEEDALAEGFIDSKINPFSTYTTKLTTYNYKISINRSNVLPEEHKLNYLFIHELLHAFGLDDVYLGKNTEDYHGNTFMMSKIGKKTNLITPNDYKCLLALYTENFENEDDKAQKIQLYKQKIDEYEKYYYDNFAETMVKELQVTEKIERTQFLWKGYAEFKLGDGQPHPYYYNIEIKDGRYKFEIVDTNNNVVDSVTGEAYITNGIVILQEVVLQEGIVPKSNVNYKKMMMDYMLVKENSLVNFVDIAHDVKIYGFKTFLQPENSINEKN